MATTQTAGVGRIHPPSGWGQTIIGIAIGALLAGLVGAWMLSGDSRSTSSAAATPSVSAYTLRKVLQAETAGGGAAVAQPPTVRPNPVGGVTPNTRSGNAYSLAKVEQVKDAGVLAGASLAGDVGSNAYTMYKLEQVKGTAKAETAVSSPAPPPGLVE